MKKDNQCTLRNAAMRGRLQNPARSVLLTVTMEIYQMKLWRGLGESHPWRMWTITQRRMNMGIAKLTKLQVGIKIVGLSTKAEK